MSDNEIIKALKCCAPFQNRKCAECPAWGELNLCESVVKSQALDLINRQKAEIERLNSCVKSEDEIRAIMKDQMSSIVRETVNEQIDIAIKLTRIAFAERLKAEFTKTLDDCFCIPLNERIDKLVKETIKE